MPYREPAVVAEPPVRRSSAWRRFWCGLHLHRRRDIEPIVALTFRNEVAEANGAGPTDSRYIRPQVIGFLCTQCGARVFSWTGKYRHSVWPEVNGWVLIDVNKDGAWWYCIETRELACRSVS